MWNIDKYERTKWNQHHECLNREHRICEFVIWTQQTTKHINQLLKFNTLFPFRFFLSEAHAKYIRLLLSARFHCYRLCVRIGGIR